MKFNQAIAFISASLMSCTAFTANKPAQERWFEVEVIIFSQLGDKSLLKEAFPDNDELSPLPSYPRVLDLLNDYLQPNISSLKQLVPYCSNPEYPQSLVQQSKAFSPLHSEKTLTDIENLQHDDVELDGEIEQESAFEHEPQLSLSNQEESEQLTGDLEKLTINSEKEQTTNQVIDDFSPFDEENIEFVSLITDEQKTAVIMAEQAFSDIQFISYQSMPSQRFCVLPLEDFEPLVQEKQTFSYDRFHIDAVPSTINGIENLYNATPYLINTDSLQLHDIVKQLKRSKNFKPILHVGWREAPKGRGKETAHKIYAGDNLQYHYEKADEDYQLAYQEAVEQEQAMFDAMMNTDSLSDENSPQAEQRVNEQDLISTTELATTESVTKSQRINQRIQEILSQVEQIDELDTNTLFAQIDDPDLPLALELVPVPLSIANPPLEPVQPWYLDGLFKVHLNHYLYITADFNIMSMTLAEQARHIVDIDNSSEIKAIRFQQNRRVISGEIHYFDHPYMGMIVQIRKHKRPSPDEEIDQKE